MIINNLNDIPRIIYKRRIEQGMTQVILAKRSGISQQTISSFEKGDLHVSLFTLFKILRSLNYQMNIVDDSSQEKRKLLDMRKILDIQGADGNWNFDEYMFGMYNGMELMMSLEEGREPIFRERPENWLIDREVNTEIVSESLTDEEIKKRFPLFDTFVNALKLTKLTK